MDRIPDDLRDRSEREPEPRQRERSRERQDRGPRPRPHFPGLGGPKLSSLNLLYFFSRCFPQTARAPSLGGQRFSPFWMLVLFLNLVLSGFHVWTAMYGDLSCRKWTDWKMREKELGPCAFPGGHVGILASRAEGEAREFLIAPHSTCDSCFARVFFEEQLAPCGYYGRGTRSLSRACTAGSLAFFLSMKRQMPCKGESCYWKHTCPWKEVAACFRSLSLRPWQPVCSPTRLLYLEENTGN